MLVHTPSDCIIARRTRPRGFARELVCGENLQSSPRLVCTRLIRHKTRVWRSIFLWQMCRRKRGRIARTKRCCANTRGCLEPSAVEKFPPPKSNCHCSRFHSRRQSVLLPRIDRPRGLGATFFGAYFFFSNAVIRSENKNTKLKPIKTCCVKRNSLSETENFEKIRLSIIFKICFLPISAVVLF